MAPMGKASEPFRLLGGGLIDRGRAFSFSFDGRSYVGRPGDTLASALLANGVHLAGRSFKYHRPRGIMAAGAEEPNALVGIDRHPRAGVAVGLAWTAAGGEVLTIESVTMRGKGNIKVTGQLGEVMSESASLALSYVRSQAAELQLEPASFEALDLHVLHHLAQVALVAREQRVVDLAVSLRQLAVEDRVADHEVGPARADVLEHAPPRRHRNEVDRVVLALVGEARVEVDTKVEGAPVEVAFNPDYVIEGLNAMAAETVTLRISGKDTPSRLDGEENYVYVVMPVTVRVG